MTLSYHRDRMSDIHDYTGHWLQSVYWLEASTYTLHHTSESVVFFCTRILRHDKPSYNRNDSRHCKCTRESASPVLYSRECHNLSGPPRTFLTPRPFTSKTPVSRPCSLCIVARPCLSSHSFHCKILSQRIEKKKKNHYSSSMNSTMTVPFFSPASAMGTSSISMRFLPMLMSSKLVFSLPSKGAALSHS